MIDRDELEAYSRGLIEDQFESILGRKVSAAEIFSAWDHNKDGQISFQEFLTGACDKQDLINDESLQAAFNVLDKNGDGQLSIEELKWRFNYINIAGLTTELQVKDDFW